MSGTHFDQTLVPALVPGELTTLEMERLMAGRSRYIHRKVPAVAAVAVCSAGVVAAVSAAPVAVSPLRVVAAGTAVVSIAHAVAAVVEVEVDVAALGPGAVFGIGAACLGGVENQMTQTQDIHQTASREI